MEKPAEAGGAPLGGEPKLCEGDTRIGRAIIIIDLWVQRRQYVNIGPRGDFDAFFSTVNRFSMRYVPISGKNVTGFDG